MNISLVMMNLKQGEDASPAQDNNSSLTKISRSLGKRDCFKTLGAERAEHIRFFDRFKAITLVFRIGDVLTQYWTSFVSGLIKVKQRLSLYFFNDKVFYNTIEESNNVTSFADNKTMSSRVVTPLSFLRINIPNIKVISNLGQYFSIGVGQANAGCPTFLADLLNRNTSVGIDKPSYIRVIHDCYFTITI